MFAMLAIGAVGAVVFSIYFVPHIDALRLAGQADTAEFKTLHKQSEHLMTGLMAVIFVAAMFLPAFCRGLLAAAKPGSDSLAA